MLKGDGATVDALEKQYKATEQELDGYKIGLGAVMGANVYGKRGNQLLDEDRWNTTQDAATRAPLMGVETPTPGDKPGLHIRNQSPQFEMNNTPKYVAGLDDDATNYKPYKDDIFSKKSQDKGNSGGGFGGGGSGGSWGDEDKNNVVPDYIKQNYAGDAESLEYIKSTDMFEKLAENIEKYGSNENIEAKLNLNVTGTSEVNISQKDAKKQYIELCENKDMDKNIELGIYDIMLGIMTGSASVPVSALISAGSLGVELAFSKGSMNYDLLEKLGGTYKVSSFTLDADWDFKEIGGGGKHQVQTGYVIYGDPIELDNGVIIENPFNAVFFDTVPKIGR